MLIARNLKIMNKFFYKSLNKCTEVVKMAAIMGYACARLWQT